MMHFLLTCRIRLILNRKLANAQRDYQKNQERLQAFRRDQTKLHAHWKGTDAQAYKAQLLEMKRLSIKSVYANETCIDSLHGASTGELKEILAILTGPQKVIAS